MPSGQETDWAYYKTDPGPTRGLVTLKCYRNVTIICFLDTV